MTEEDIDFLSDNSEHSDCDSMFNNCLQEKKIVCTKISLTSPLFILNFPTLEKNTHVVASIGSADFINDFDCTKMSKSFIKPDDSGLKICENIPTLKKNTPVIACIGSSRDGKSTSLNLYLNYILHKTGNTKNLPNEPFITSDSDQATTIGIDFYHEDTCLLIDCQGMALGNAKYDTHLALITYLISDVLILTVRNRLDLIALDHLKDMFSFLHQIPSWACRQTKSKLLIRIKDFAVNNEFRKKGEIYLRELLDEWLTPKKSNSQDQYSKLRNVIKETFEIHIVITIQPKTHTDARGYDLPIDIYNESFNTLNPTFNNFCDKIYELSQNVTKNELLFSPDKLNQLIDNIINNKNIDCDRIDQYTMINTIDVIRYIESNINIHPFISMFDQNLITGLEIGSSTVDQREKMIDELYEDVYNKKFKDLEDNIKLKELKPIFDKIYNIVKEARQNNINAAEALIKIPYETYLFRHKQLTNVSGEELLGVYNRSKIIFFEKLLTLDRHVQTKYKKYIDAEKLQIDYLINTVERMDKGVLLEIDNSVKKYDTRTKFIEYCDKYISEITNAKKNYNIALKELYDICLNEIKKNLDYIYKEKYGKYYITAYQIDGLSEENIIFIKHDNYNIYNASWNITMNQDKYFETIKIKMENHLLKIGLLQYIDTHILSYIDFMHIIVFDIHYTTTIQFYKMYFEKMIIKFLRNKKYLIFTITNNLNNTIGKIDFVNKEINPIPQLEENIKHSISVSFTEYLMNFTFTNKILLTNSNTKMVN
jgi:hypothetical protein